jgi:hypothetical protein
MTGTSQGSGTNPFGKALSLAMNEVSSSWPLIRYLADDSLYFQKYKSYIKTFNIEVLSKRPILDMIDKYSSIISPFVIGVNGEQPNYTHLPDNSAFLSGKLSLKTHIENRKKLIDEF